VTLPSGPVSRPDDSGLCDQRTHPLLVGGIGGEQHPYPNVSSPAGTASVWCGASGHGGSWSQCPHSATVIAPPGARESPPGSRITTASWAYAARDMSGWRCNRNGLGDRAVLVLVLTLGSVVVVVVVVVVVGSVVVVVVGSVVVVASVVVGSVVVFAVVVVGAVTDVVLRVIGVSVVGGVSDDVPPVISLTNP